MIGRVSAQRRADRDLLADRGEFACADPGTINVQFDAGIPTAAPGKLPDTDEPAIQVEDFRTFVNALPRAERVRFEFTLDDGSTHTAEFEVDAYVEDTIGSLLGP